MASLKEFFEIDFAHTIKIVSDNEIIIGGKNISYCLNLNMDFLSGVFFPAIYTDYSFNNLSEIAYFINATYNNFKFTKHIKQLPDSLDYLGVTVRLENCNADKYMTNVINVEFPDNPPKNIKEDLVFVNTVYFYINNKKFTKEDWSHIKSLLLDKNTKLNLRGENYRFEKEQLQIQKQEPMAFVSHDSKDKETIVRGLVQQLIEKRCTVWYDEFSLNIGSSLRESIEQGIKKCRKCILIVSQNFLKNNGWGKAEFNNIFTKEIFQGNNVVIPIWCGVSARDVYDYSPWLADRMASTWDADLENQKRVIANIVRAINL